MTRPPTRAAAAALAAAVLLAAAEAAAQFPNAEQRAYDAVDRAVAAFQSASGRAEMTRAAGRLLDAARTRATDSPDPTADATPPVPGSRRPTNRWSRSRFAATTATTAATTT